MDFYDQSFNTIYKIGIFITIISIVIISVLLLIYYLLYRPYYIELVNEAFNTYNI